MLAEPLAASKKQGVLMRLVNTDHGFGRLEGDVVTIMWPTPAAFFAGAPPADSATLDIGQVTVLAPSPAPEKVVCVGLNYRRHAEEAGMAVPTVPVLFPKFANSIAAPGATVAVPPATEQVDYEAELAVVIGRRCSMVDVATALEHVAGYCCANDLSARDLQFATSQWMLGKAIDGFLPLGPWLVTPDEVGDPQRLQLHCWVNGERRQSTSTEDMVFSVAEIISFASRTCALVPGDVVITGTPFGVGMGFDPPKWLRTGDEVVVEIERLGRLVTRLS
jgi:2-keto-4-pentenoate hydratase/2-oxohepta-3-ene-1,7-dioic acid hydratase in catechol pathway